MNTEQMFLNANYDNKISYLQDEHKIVLKILYDDACNRKIIQDFEYDKYLVQSMSYTAIKKIAKQSMSSTVLDICLLDLCGMGFIINTMINPYKQTEYAICPLGLEYFKRLR